MLHLGKRPPTYDSRDIKYADIRASKGFKYTDIQARPTASISVPSARGGYGTDFGPGVWPGWGMYGNGPCDDGSIPSDWYVSEGAGNCAWAGPGHETMEIDKNAGRPVSKFTCLNLLNQYAEYLGLSGAEALNANNDQGSDVRSVLQWRSTKGLLDAEGVAHKIGVYVSIEPGNVQQTWEALYIFESVGIGINFPESAMDQFNKGQVWSVVPGATIDGGHYIPLVGHPTSNIWTCVTWGQRQTMTQQFLTTYCDEAWAYITPERYNAVTGDTLEGYKDADLEKFISLI